MKTIVIAGRLGKDAELRRTQDGTAVLNFTVAVDDGYGERKGTLWFDCSLFGKRGEALERHLSKGNAVTVSGDLGKREHDGKTYLTVRVSELTMQGGGEKREAAPKHERKVNRDDPREYGGRDDLDDDIPF